MAMPVLKIDAETVAKAWEKAVIAVWKRGIRKITQYRLTKEKKTVNQESRAATVLIVVKKPLKEPRMHAGDTVGQQAIISGYIDEMLEGTKDFYVEQGKWAYTYHERLVNYKTPSTKPINQLNNIVNKLKQGDLFSRRLQAVTWQVWKDMSSENPPCFQRLWVTVPTQDWKAEPGKTYGINVQTCWRSRDLFNAWSANVNAIVELCERKIVKNLNETFDRVGARFEVGQYVDFSNDLHIYEKDFKEVEDFILTLKRKEYLGKSRQKIRKGQTIQTLIEIGKTRRNTG